MFGTEALSPVDRQIMNMDIDTARKVIGITASSYGWDKWLNVREDVQQATTNPGQS